MDKIQSQRLVGYIDKSPRGGYTSPETYLVQLRVNGKLVTGITSNVYNLGDFGEPEIGGTVDALVDDGLGGQKIISGTVTSVLGIFEEGALNKYEEVFRSINEKNKKIDLPFKDFIKILEKSAGNDHVISESEASSDSRTILSENARYHRLSIIPVTPPKSDQERWLSAGEDLLLADTIDETAVLKHLGKLYSGIDTQPESIDAIVSFLSFSSGDPAQDQQIEDVLGRVMIRANANPKITGGSFAPTVMFEWMLNTGDDNSLARVTHMEEAFMDSDSDIGSAYETENAIIEQDYAKDPKSNSVTGNTEDPSDTGENNQKDSSVYEEYRNSD